MFPWLPRFCSHRRQPKTSPLEPDAGSESVTEGTEAFAVVSSVSPELPDLTTDPRTEHVVQLNEQLLCGLVGLLPEELELQSVRDDIRWYAVWDVPFQKKEQIAGVHWGKSTCAYSGILSLAQNKFKGIKWQRCKDRVSAETRFKLEAERFALPGSLGERVFGWVPGYGA